MTPAYPEGKVLGRASGNDPVALAEGNGPGKLSGNDGLVNPKGRAKGVEFSFQTDKDLFQKRNMKAKKKSFYDFYRLLYFSSLGMAFLLLVRPLLDPPHGRIA